ncbi:MAG: hypothetical protein JW836_14765, partial [Deltaproteobacteria bacterium]|nr:hypothetical protein [Deltaproteobacteria bacterium]
SFVCLGIEDQYRIRADLSSTIRNNVPLYGDTVALAPVYDVVTTTAYIRKDVPALSLVGTKKWWPRKVLERFAVTHLSLPVASIAGVFNRIAEAVTETGKMIPRYIAEHPEFREIGERMMTQWDEGVTGLFG